MLSVVIPTYNKLSRLQYVIKGLEMQNARRDQFEVIIVNDGSTDQTQQYLESIQPNFALEVVEQENKGQAVARNKGIAKAKGDIILFIDDDILIPPDFIENHIYAHKMNPNTIVLGKINLIYANLFDQIENMFLQKVIQKFWIAFIGYAARIYILAWLRQFIRRDLTNYFGFVSREQFSVEHKMLEKVGFFDEQFIDGTEDIELGYRFNLSRTSFMYHPECYCFHLDLLKERNQMMRDTMKNIKYLKKSILTVLPFRIILISQAVDLRLKNFIVEKQG